MRFPILNSANDLREKVLHKEEIREASVTPEAAGGELSTFCYMIAAENTFDDSWSRECRGIVFDRKGVAGRPLHKFFNVNEREETQAHALDWSKVVRVMDKRDGSMIHTVIIPLVSHAGLDDQWTVRLKSKKSFDSEVARDAEKFLKLPENEPLRRFIHLMSAHNQTVIFEWTSPTARIVLAYPTPELRVLHVRDNRTGEYRSREVIEALLPKAHGGPFSEIKLVDEPKFDVPKEQLGAHLLELAKTAKDIEGWVVQFEDGEMVKLKTAWYLERHRAMTFLRERDIAEMVVSPQQSLDDLKALLVGDGVDIRDIIDIESRVLEDIRNLERRLEALVEPHEFKVDRKTFVFAHREAAGELFGLLMNKYSGQKPNYIEFFTKNMLKQTYTLRQLNLVPSVAEAD